WQIRAAPDSAALAFLRSPADRRRRCGTVCALDRRSLRATVPAVGTRLKTLLFTAFRLSRAEQAIRRGGEDKLQILLSCSGGWLGADRICCQPAVIEFIVKG